MDVEKQTKEEGQKKYLSYNVKLAFDMVKLREFHAYITAPLAIISVIALSSINKEPANRQEELIPEETKKVQTFSI
jgi:hypothetical protein